MLAQYVVKFPIAKPDNIVKTKMIELVNIILEKPCAEIEAQIDLLAYSIYGLTESEIGYLQNK